MSFTCDLIQKWDSNTEPSTKITWQKHSVWPAANSATMKWPVRVAASQQPPFHVFCLARCRVEPTFSVRSQGAAQFRLLLSVPTETLKRRVPYGGKILVQRRPLQLFQTVKTSSCCDGVKILQKLPCGWPRWSGIIKEVRKSGFTETAEMRITPGKSTAESFEEECHSGAAQTLRVVDHTVIWDSLQRVWVLRPFGSSSSNIWGPQVSAQCPKQPLHLHTAVQCGVKSLLQSGQQGNG